MAFIGLNQTDGLVAKKLFETVSSADKIFVFGDKISDLKDVLQDENVFVFDFPIVDEMSEFSAQYADKLCADLKQIFSQTKAICKTLIDANKKAKFIFMTINPSLINVLETPAAPMRTEAIHAFVKTMSKEMLAFGLTFNSVCTEPLYEMLDEKQARIYRKSMRIYALRKTPFKTEDAAEFVKYFMDPRSKALSGSVLFISECMSGDRI